ncbi:unnamed protein product [Fraxinus pennsylvanica]|uniref:AT1G17665-like protein n=1 Tax=Fraxinus pennsylvanica TaxID=56036 RepID=A0AAD2A291_9LAMI|nr:unnamed protein product [Fraxinus pennsylvanica]
MAAASLFHIPMLSLLSFWPFLSLSVIIFALYTFLKKIDENSQEKSIKIPSLPVDDAENYEKNRTQQQKQENAYESDKNEDPNDKKGSDQEENKRKKKRRKIKLQYDQLVKSHESKSLTLAQVGKFVNCLIEARNELQNKSEVVKRKFIITKAILFKADRSSVNRLHQQIYKLEIEHKRLEDDAFVYNWLQQQLKLSPAYEKILELGACMEEIKANSVDLVESTDANFSDISFEELLAQEKKDSFWQRKGRYKPCSG